MMEGVKNETQAGGIPYRVKKNLVPGHANSTKIPVFLMIFVLGTSNTAKVTRRQFQYRQWFLWDRNLDLLDTKITNIVEHLKNKKIIIFRTLFPYFLRSAAWAEHRNTIVGMNNQESALRV